MFQGVGLYIQVLYGECFVIKRLRVEPSEKGLITPTPSYSMN